MKTPKKHTQAYDVYEYIKEHGSISQMQAYELGITRLGGIVYNLKNTYGMNIETEMVKTKNRYGHLTQYAVYKFAEEPVSNLITQEKVDKWSNWIEGMAKYIDAVNEELETDGKETNV